MSRELAQRIPSRTGPAPSFLAIYAATFILRDDIVSLARQERWIMLAYVVNFVATALGVRPRSRKVRLGRMGNVHRIQVAEINRAAKWIRANLLRLRKAKSRLGSAAPTPDKQAKLIADMKAVRHHLTGLIASASATAGADEDLAQAVRIARQVVDDCTEMLELFGDRRLVP